MLSLALAQRIVLSEADATPATLDPAIVTVITESGVVIDVDEVSLYALTVKVVPIAPVGTIPTAVTLNAAAWLAAMLAVVLAETILAPADTTNEPPPDCRFNVPVDKMVAVCVVVVPAARVAPDKSPTEFVVVAIRPLALATGAVATADITPAVNADTATTAMRCLIVFVDIYFLSLVELGNFPISARRSC